MEWMILPFKRYFDFKGRSRRKEYWMYTLFVVIVSIVLSFVDAALGLGGSASGDTDAAEATTNLTPSSFPNSASILRSSVYWTSPRRLASHSRTRLMRTHVDQENVAADHLQNVIFPLVLAHHRASFV